MSYVGPLVPVPCGHICGYGCEANRGQGEQDPDGPEEDSGYYWPTCLESSQCYASFRVNMTSSSLLRGSCRDKKTPYLITVDILEKKVSRAICSSQGESANKIHTPNRRENQE